MTPFARHLLGTALPLAIVAVIAASLAYSVASRRGDGGHARGWRAATRALLAVYAVGLIWWTIVLANPNFDGARHANLVPFREISRSLTDREPGYGLLNFWGNIVAFVPVGVLALLAIRRARPWGWAIAIASGIGLSAAIEATQYTIGRSADVDDVILNGAGVVVGVVVAALIRRVLSPAPPGQRSLPHERPTPRLGS